MPLAVCVVGRSNSGKTTLLENLVGELKRRGHTLATIKHTVHDFDLDHPGKDTWRLARAGSDTVVLSSPGKLALMKRVDDETSLEGLLQLVGNEVDFVLIEGFKTSSLPKIEVRRRARPEGILCSPAELMALVTDEPQDIPVPQFSPDDVSLLADLLERQAVARRDSDELVVSINDTLVPLSLGARDAIRSNVLGIASTIAKTEDVRTLSISLKRGRN